MINELRKQLNELLVEEIEKDGLDVVADRYGINKTDRKLILTNEFDGKFSKFVEIIEAKGMRVVISDNITTNDEISEAISEKDNVIASKNEEILEIKSQFDGLSTIITTKDEEILKLKEEILIISKDKLQIEGSLEEQKPSITKNKPKPNPHKTYFEGGMYGKY